MISSNFPITFKIFCIFEIIAKMHVMHRITDVITKIDNSYSCIVSATFTKNINDGMRNIIDGNKYCNVFQWSIRLGFGCDVKKPIVWQSLWIYWNNFNFTFDFIDAALAVTISANTSTIHIKLNRMTPQSIDFVWSVKNTKYWFFPK